MKRSTTTVTDQDLPTAARAVLAVGLLYPFLVGVGLLESDVRSLGAFRSVS